MLHFFFILAKIRPYNVSHITSKHKRVKNPLNPCRSLLQWHHRETHMFQHHGRVCGVFRCHWVWHRTRCPQLGLPGVQSASALSLLPPCLFPLSLPPPLSLHSSLLLPSLLSPPSIPSSLSPSPFISRKVRDRPSLTPQKSERESSRCMHEMLTNQILLFHFETVAAPWLQYVRLTLVQLQAVN